MTFEDSENKDLDVEFKSKQVCKCHGMCGHSSDQCTTLKAMIKKIKRKKNKHFKIERTDNKQEVNDKKDKYTYQRIVSHYKHGFISSNSSKKQE